MATYQSDLIKRRACVYRAYDEFERLLYVGMSTNIVGRISKHRHQKPWWREPVVAITEEWFDTRAEALAAEAVAIRNEDPIYNVAGVL